MPSPFMSETPMSTARAALELRARSSPNLANRRGVAVDDAQAVVVAEDDVGEPSLLKSPAAAVDAGMRSPE